MEPSDLEVLAPTPRKVAFRGEAVEVLPLQLRQLAAFTTATRPIMARVFTAVGLLEEGATLHVGAVLFDLLEQDAASLCAALAIASGRDEDFIGGGTLAEVADLAEVVVEVNHDFFARRLPALLERARPAIAAMPRTRRPPPATPEVAPAASPEPAKDGSSSSTTSSPGATTAGT